MLQGLGTVSLPLVRAYACWKFLLAPSIASPLHVVVAGLDVLAHGRSGSRAGKLHIHFLATRLCVQSPKT